MLLRCCLIQISINILRHFLYLQYLCPCQGRGYFKLFLCDLKQTPSYMFYRKSSKLLQSIILRNILICVTESNHIKDHLQPGVKHPPFALIAPKYETSARKEAQKQKINTIYTRLKGCLVFMISVFIYMTSFVPICRDEYVRWYCLGFGSV